MVAARAPTGTAPKNPRRPFGTVDRADRRRQDTRRIFADAGGVECGVTRLASSPLPPRSGGVRPLGRGWGVAQLVRALMLAPNLPKHPPPPTPPRHALRARREGRSVRVQRVTTKPLRAKQRHLHRARRAAQPWPSHPLHFAAESARGRYCAQPGNADRADEPADQGRDPHRRHAGIAAAAAAALPAGYPAHHAGTTGAAVVVRRRAVSVRLVAAHRARRIACAGHLQARRPVSARPGAAVAAGAPNPRDRAVGDGRRTGIAGAVSGAAARRQR